MQYSIICMEQVILAMISAEPVSGLFHARINKQKKKGVELKHVMEYQSYMLFPEDEPF